MRSQGRGADRLARLARLAGLAGLAALATPRLARATPGPDSVAVLANADLPGSVALAQAYADARDIPARQICALSLPDTPDLDFESFRETLETPLRACLDAAGVTDRIEAIVLTRGVPLRIGLPAEAGGGRVSLAAALSLWSSTALDSGERLLGRPPGRLVPCGEGVMCLGAAWRNPYTAGRFRAGWALDSGRVHWAPMLVTALFGRNDEDALRLVEASVLSDGARHGAGEILLMDAADPARGALDGDADFVLPGLLQRGIAARRVPFDGGLSGLTLAGFVTGTASLGAAIEGNTFVPGALVDNLTSFGAVAENFAPEGESQVSIARWVAQGVTGVHGTTDEPLNNCFPRRQFLLDFADGATLAEAFHSNLPFVYWHNLVIGDPMAAPYAVRPQVELSLPPLEDASGWLSVASIDPAARGEPLVRIYADGVEVGLPSPGHAIRCVVRAEASVEWLVVAQAADDGTPGAHWAPKGWRRISAAFVPGEGCPSPDAGVVGRDAGAVADAETPGADVAPDAETRVVDMAPAVGDADPLAADSAVVETDARPLAPDAAPAAVADSLVPDGLDGGLVIKRGGASAGCAQAGPGRGTPGMLGVGGLLSVLLSVWLPGRRRRRRDRAPVEPCPGAP